MQVLKRLLLALLAASVLAEDPGIVLDEPLKLLEANDSINAPIRVEAAFNKPLEVINVSATLIDMTDDKNSVQKGLRPVEMGVESKADRTQLGNTGTLQKDDSHVIPAAGSTNPRVVEQVKEELVEPVDSKHSANTDTGAVKSNDGSTPVDVSPTTTTSSNPSPVAASPPAPAASDGTSKQTEVNTVPETVSPPAATTTTTSSKSSSRGATKQSEADAVHSNANTSPETVTEIVTETLAAEIVTETVLKTAGSVGTIDLEKEKVTGGGVDGTPTLEEDKKSPIAPTTTTSSSTAEGIGKNEGGDAMPTTSSISKDEDEDEDALFLRQEREAEKAALEDVEQLQSKEEQEELALRAAVQQDEINLIAAEEEKKQLAAQQLREDQATLKRSTANAGSNPNIPSPQTSSSSQSSVSAEDRQRQSQEPPQQREAKLARPGAGLRAGLTPRGVGGDTITSSSTSGSGSTSTSTSTSTSESSRLRPDVPGGGAGTADAVGAGGLGGGPKLGQKRFDLEDMVSEHTRTLAKEGEESKLLKAEGMRLREKANRLPRSVARPVEHTLKVYHDLRTDLFDVLGLSRDADDGDLKRAYRTLALKVSHES